MRSDRWLNIFLQKTPFENPLKEIPQVAEQALADYHPYQHRREDQTFALEHCLDNKSSTGYSLNFLGKLSEEFLENKGDRVEINPKTLDDWSRLISKVDPVWILGWKYAELLWNEELTVAQFAQLDGKQCPNAFPEQDKTKEFADNHAHLNGTGSSNFALFDYSWDPYKSSGKTQWSTLPEFSYLNSNTIKQDEIPFILNNLFLYMFKQIFSLGGNRPEISNPISLRPKRNSFATITKLIEANNIPQQLIARTQSDSIYLDHKWLMLITALLYVERYDNGNSDYKIALRAYLHTANILRAQMIMAGVGLNDFVKFYRLTSRKGNNINRYSSYSFDTDMAENISREYKVTPNLLNYKNLQNKDFKNEIIKIIKNNKDGRVHFAIHFTRGIPKKSSRFNRLQETKRRNIRDEVYDVQRVMGSADLQNKNLRINDQNDSKNVNLTHLIRGIDIAGNENELAIEIFAPAIRMLRSSKQKSLADPYKRVKIPHLTVHAGEDYSHLISGLRNIDETVRFCEFKSGDRLGHALALGIDPFSWASSQSVIYIPAVEHLDNLVWCHKHAIDVSLRKPEFAGIIALIEKKIQLLSKYVYEKVKSPETLYKAWELRRNCPLYALKLAEPGQNQQADVWAPDFTRGKKPNDKEAYKLWYKYLHTYHHKNQTKNSKPNAHTIVCIQVNSDGHNDIDFSSDQPKDWITEQELHLFKAIQDYLIQKYDNIGIIVEACPSSNIYIGRFSGYEEHPIFRWYPPESKLLEEEGEFNKYGLRTGPIKVCVNTDDAGIFPTTIANEHRILKETAIKRFGISTEQADLWINRIREIGVEEFKRNHLPLIN
ncbi:hypothetical protein J7W08_01910 [Methanococcoides orientis]|uniref:antiviral RADAR system adenosine deaminase RdrB n=1 Tax=Methanococcoides orientis TaxID=2822137 RepID=UPI001E4276DA|nr:antiviral RADAR system adenosine deaminase RdrB [Methanococcoides orientis]UGV41089.1 hypothetical protein J7W08_01910 [Methanococcoides orientis]